MNTSRLLRYLLMRFERLRHGVPLTVQALIVTGAAGVLFWFLQDTLHTQRLREIVHTYLFEDLRRAVQIDWLRLDERLRGQVRTTRLLVERQALVDHIAQLEAMGEWSRSQNPELIRHQEPASWWPVRRALREPGYAVHALLVDGLGRPRELQVARDKPLPLAIMETFAKECLSVETGSALRIDGGHSYYLSCAVLNDGVNGVQAILLLVAPLDNDFLLSFDALRDQDGLLVFLDESGERVMASSRPERVATATPLQSLRANYLMFGKEITDGGPSSTVDIRFAGLIPKSRLDELSMYLMEEGRRQWAIGHLLMIAVFVLIIYWMGRTMETLTRRMVTFARQRLNLSLSAAAPGNALRQMIEQFDILSAEIEEARAREAEASARLAQSNQALESSLTMLKRTHVQLLASEKMAALGGLVAGVAHEINTPVGIGVTAASFLESKTREFQNRYAAGNLSRADLEAYLEDAVESSSMILSNLIRAAELVRSFKQVAVDSSSEASRLFDFHTVIHQILQSLHPRLKKTPHKVTVHCPEDLVHFGRPDVFSQIITNFVLNSLQHGFADDQAGEMRIDMARNGAEIVLHYADNGRGMGEEERARIFEPFFTTARHKGGSGLGMHIVFNLATATLGGEIRCQSAPEQGTAFTIAFPARRERFLAEESAAERRE
ncbi:MAG: HAMP domain-containing histidine kinase [Magnetococcales bacterium]|nr:HAMP domain-containing histidine kinase [Magnetococcales bacterium]